ncbi:hypothetical protein [Peribacillus sp. FSL E2-0218]|uniref:hypothetical protein n=1 Tax=Peribacillus sp. FSL E2-0218 TaxID=2921364 RepID=UPI0030EE27AD
MDRKTRKKLFFIIFGLMIAFPIVINILMFLHVFPVKGDVNTWISLLGTFWGAIISGVISGILTLLGVQLTIKDNNELKKKEDYPGKLFRIEKLLSSLESAKDDFDNMLALNFGEKANIFFEINENYGITKTEKHKKYTSALFEDINQDIVYVDSKSYRMFFESRRKMTDLYQENMWKVEYSLFEFTEDLIKKYSADGVDVVNINWANLKLDEDQKDVIKELKIELYKSERKYLYLLSEVVNDLYYQLTEHYLDLIDEINY